MAAAPMVARLDGTLELVGGRELSEPGDFMYLDGAALEELARKLAALKSGIVIPRLPEASPTLGALRRAARGRAAFVVRPAGATPVLELGEDPEDRFSVRRRGDLRRARRRAEAIGPVSAQVLSPTQNELAPLLAEVIAVEAAGWKGARGTALLHDPKRKRFFEEYALASAGEGSLRLCVLRIGEAAAAVQLAVEHARRLWLLKIGYDERFARCSPGTLLLLETARWANDRKLDAIELLGEREPWTRLWTDRERPSVSVRVYPATARGARSLASHAVTHARRAVSRRVIDRAGLAHLAGGELGEAIAACHGLAERGFRVILGYWDAAADTPAEVESISLSAVEALADAGLDGYVSIKPGALGFARSRIAPIVARGAELGLPVHFDSTGPEDAEPSWALLSELAGPGLGCTLPSRWGRSLADAERASELGLRVRIVKGQWPDPDQPSLDESAGFVALAEAVAGRVPHVAVATHDSSLAESALGRLTAAGTPVEHELMFGLPFRADASTPQRVYVPFGHPSLPYAPGRARASARVAGWVVRDLARGLFRR